MSRVVGNLGRRAVEALVLMFASLGFVHVPLGQKTGLEHVTAIVASRAFGEASRELTQAVVRARERLLSSPHQTVKPERAPASLHRAAPADAGPDVSITP